MPGQPSMMRTTWRRGTADEPARCVEDAPAQRLGLGASPSCRRSRAAGTSAPGRRPSRRPPSSSRSPRSWRTGSARAPSPSGARCAVRRGRGPAWWVEVDRVAVAGRCRSPSSGSSRAGNRLRWAPGCSGSRRTMSRVPSGQLAEVDDAARSPRTPPPLRAARRLGDGRLPDLLEARGVEDGPV